MTKEQFRHLARIQDLTIRRIAEKYTAGAAEHTGNLWDQSEIQLVENAIDEAIDQISYLVTLREKLLLEPLVGQPASAGPDGN